MDNMHVIIMKNIYDAVLRLIWLNDCMIPPPDEYDWIGVNGWFRLQIKMTEWLCVWCRRFQFNMTEGLMHEVDMYWWLYDADILVNFPVLWYPHDHVILLFLQSYHIISSKHYLDHCGHRRLPTQFCNCKIYIVIL